MKNQLVKIIPNTYEQGIDKIYNIPLNTKKLFKTKIGILMTIKQNIQKKIDRSTLQTRQEYYLNIKFLSLPTLRVREADRR